MSIAPSQDTQKTEKSVILVVKTGRQKVDTGESWKDIIFLPFNRIVLLTFMVVTYLSVMYNIYLLTYHPKDIPFLVRIGLDIVCELIYFAIVVILILHRLMKVHRQRMIYKANPMLLIGLDFISLFPLGSLYHTINRYTWEKHFNGDQLNYDNCYLKFCRIIRLIFFYHDLRSNLTNNQTSVIIICHFLGSCLVIFTLGAGFFQLGINPPTKDGVTWMKSWMDAEITFDKTSYSNWFIICTYEFAGLYFNNSLKPLFFTNMNEIILIFISMLFGFISQYTFLLGTLTSENLEGMRAKHDLQLRLDAARKLMKTLIMPEHLQNTVHLYYDTIWNYRFGVVTMPNIVRKLPPVMQSELRTDIYWEALLHTKIFNNVSSVFRKVIAESMKTEIYMKGHLVFRDNDVKAKLVYIQSGMLEVFTMNSDDSIITLTSGSVLCEVSCIHMMKCTANVKCLTNCTLHVLYMVDFYKALLKNYSHEFKAMQSTYNNRVSYCKKKLPLVGKQVKMAHMRWVKTQWLNMFEKKRTTHDLNFTSRYLDLIAIMTTQNHPNAFCLRGNCPFVMVTDTNLYFFFYYLTLMTTALNFFITFQDIFFETGLVLDNYKYYVLIDLVFFVDIYVQCITTIKTYHRVIDQPYEILVYRLKNIFFVLDAIATLPMDYLAIMVHVNAYSLGFIRANRYIRLYKLVLFFYHHEKQVTSYSVLLKFFKFVTYHTLLSLLLTCAVYMCNCYDNTCHPDGFLELWKQEHLQKIGSKIAVTNFFICFYYTANIYLKLLLRVYNQLYLPDLMMKVLIIVISYYMVTIQMAQVCASVGLKSERSHILQEHVEMIDIYLQGKKELKKYKNRLLEILSAEWSISSDLRFSDLCKVTHQESEFLRRNVNDEYILYILEQTRFFKIFPHDLLIHLAHRCEIFLIPEGHQLVQFDNRCFYLYIVVQGFCIGKSYTAGDFEKNVDTYYKRLDVFPLLEYLHQVNSLMDIRSYTAVQVLTIPYSTFQASISMFNLELQTLKAVLTNHMINNGGLLMGNRVTAKVFVKAVADELGQEDRPVMFQYRLRDQTLILDIKNCSQQKSHDSIFLKYRYCLRYSMLSTYIPNSRYYISYEIFRCFCILIHVNLTFYQCLAPVYLNKWTHVAFFSLCLLWFCDMLIQAHLQYYNEHGILVKNLRATARNYFRNSFTIGFLAGLPYELFRLVAFQRKERQLSCEIIILLCTRVFLLVRPYKLSNYLQGNGVTKAQRLLKYITNVLVVYHSIMYLSGMKLLLTCDIDEDRKYICPKTSWIMLRTSYTDWDESKYFWITVRSIIVTGVTVEDIVSLHFDHVMTLIIAIVVIGIRVALLSKITGDNCVRQAHLIDHQDSVKRYNIFFRNRLVSNSTKNGMLKHYKNIWQKSYAEKSRRIFANIYPHLRETLLLTMYSEMVSKCILFKDTNIVLFKLFIPYLEERYYTKNAPIIRTNDVQGNIFIVVQGSVEMSVADTRLAVLGIGGLFGCFEPLGYNRHTMAAKALQQTNVLVIKSRRFYQLIKGFYKTECLMKRLRITQFQYASQSLDKHDESSSTVTEESVHTTLVRHKYRKIFMFYMYMTNVHIAPLSAYLVLIDCQLEIGVMKLLPLWIVLDLYFGLCLICRGKVPIVDTKTGMELWRQKDLLIHYLKSFLFIIDVVSLLPIYLIRVWEYSDYHQLWFLLNKLLRLYFLYHHYQTYVLAKNIPRHIQWTFLVYSTLFLAQLIFITWWFILGLPYEEKINQVYLFIGYIIMMNYVTTCGLPHDATYKPTNGIELTLEIIQVVMSTCLTIALATLFTKGVISGNSYECVYRHRARFCKQFCRISDVSDALVTRTWHYLHFLYKKQGGEQFPNLYKYAPRYLKQDHMQSLFGKYFNDHRLFFDLHIDLMKQIQTYIKCYYFMPGSIIAERGSKNGEFYFVQFGSVVAIQATSDEDPNLTYEILGPGKSFGEIQAFLNLEHNRTYKALTSVDLIAVTVSDWEYLLDWFPASKQKLLSRVNEDAEILKYT